jgi:phage terminase small subunit
MSNKLTPKQEKFCQQIAKGSNQKEAYINAGYSVDNMKDETLRNNAYMLTLDSDISARINELKTKVENRIAEALVYTAKQSFDKLNQLQRLAEANIEISPNSVNAALKAEELKGKLAKLYVEQAEDLTKRDYQETVIRFIDGKTK